MEHVNHTTEPQPVLVETYMGFQHYIVHANITHDAETGTWSSDKGDFWVPLGEVELAAVQASPASYLDYLTAAARAGALEKVQQWRDEKEKTPARIECPALGFDIRYSQNILGIISAITLSMLIGIRQTFTWTGYDERRRKGLGMDELKQIAIALDSYINGFQEAADDARDLILSASTNAEVAAALAPLNLQ